jgi:2-phosphoglycerate kinase
MVEQRRLVLIGGSAGTGKTTVARALSRSLDAGWLQVDTLWLALIDAAEPGSARQRVLDVDDALRNGTEAGKSLVTQHLAAAAMVCDALPRALAFELQTHRTVVADGAWILPEWSAKIRLDGVLVTPIFLHEPDPDRLRLAMESRRSLPMVAPWHERSARLALLYGERIAMAASRVGLPVVEPRPYETLVDRVGAHLG